MARTIELRFTIRWRSKHKTNTQKIKNKSLTKTITLVTVFCYFLFSSDMSELRFSRSFRYQPHKELTIYLLIIHVIVYSAAKETLTSLIRYFASVLTLYLIEMPFNTFANREDPIRTA